ncbi:PaaI-thioesterase [Syncephalis pseudoplumigaleata]|uniref:Acyl-coenzyme A thioesterase 13 n=1 Tax=Syncephalis pseudoplumigaleata TaxID=1712513 RepID=A0A4P9YXR7_9FUNG|nr:PaaI-thioesterase [Syncephalis pseudoplumigaleata]|eukprot:RKP24718.1 PaaI-thioesterase [Syncephalis pseudoplumigaleata]
MEELPPFEAVMRSQQYFAHNARGYDSTILGRLKVESATKGRVVTTLVVEECHLNANGNIHGGVLASIVDVASSFAIASAGCYGTGVSTDLNISYLSSADLGDTITIEATCARLGKTLAYTTTEIRKGQVIVAQGRHTKFVAQAFALQKKVQQASKL